MRIKVFFLAVILIICLAACGKAESRREIYVMDSVASIRIFPKDEAAADEMCNILNELDSDFSHTSGAIYKINKSGGGEVSEHISEVLMRSLALSEKTDGAFNPVLGAVTELWGIGEKNNIPQEEKIREAVGASNADNLKLRHGEILLSNGAKINLGAVAKGYASDILREKLIERGIKSAIISLGGNIYAHGIRPDGEKWNIAIRDPFGDADEWKAILALEESFVISSGDYERYFISGGKKYHHIIDPETGYPAESDLASVTVVCNSGTLGDAYSTALYVMGKEAALSFWRKEKNFEMLLIEKDGKVILTEGLRKSFLPNAEKEVAYEIAER